MTSVSLHAHVRNVLDREQVLCVVQPGVCCVGSIAELITVSNTLSCTQTCMYVRVLRAAIATGQAVPPIAVSCIAPQNDMRVHSPFTGMRCASAHVFVS